MRSQVRVLSTGQFLMSVVAQLVERMKTFPLTFIPVTISSGAAKIADTSLDKKLRKGQSP